MTNKNPTAMVRIGSKPAKTDERRALRYGLRFKKVVIVVPLLAALLLTQFVAFPAALALGHIGNRYGARNGILLCIVVYFGATVYAYWLQTVTQFFALAVVIGLVQGGIQSLSRSFFGRLVPEGKGGEFFGFFNMMGKFASFLGPMLIGIVALTTGDSRASIVSLVVLFLIGGILLWRVPKRPVSSTNSVSSP